MADLIDEQTGAPDAEPDTPVTLDDIVAAVPQEDEAQPAESSKVDTEIELPEKYRGKSISEIVQMHQEAESVIGKQGAEVGQLRGIVDSFIQQNPQRAQPEPARQEEEVDFFDDPKAAVNKVVETHPSVIAAREAARRMEQATAVAELQKKHPDIQQVLADGEFVKWVQASPIRTQLFRDAETNFNSAAADELLSTFKERKELAAKTQKVEEVAQKQAKQAASTGALESSGESSKKFFRRSDIINLRINDPARYEQLQPEIMKAYAEKRVIT